MNNQDKITEALRRGVERIYPNEAALAQKLSGSKKLRLYCGFDPSAPSLHIGNAILLNKLRQFQELGHEVVFLIGDFTGMIGDPTDKSSTRQQLSRQEVSDNAKNYQNQAQAYLNFEGDNPAVVKYNSEWQDAVNFYKLAELSSHFTVQQMIQRDMFQERLKEEKPIYLHEFLYPLAQAYDSVALEVDLEVGGNDQMFNMMAGRDLMKSLKLGDKSVMTLKILADAEGHKMGKTAGNALFLDTDPDNMFGVVMSWPDEVIVPAFELATTVSWDQVHEISQRLDRGDNPRDLKQELALELVKTFYDEMTAEQAQANFSATIQQGQAPEELREIDADGQAIFEAVIDYFGGDKSKSEIKRLFQQNAISLNDAKTRDLELIVSSGDVIKVGKLNWFKVK